MARIAGPVDSSCLYHDPRDRLGTQWGGGKILHRNTWKDLKTNRQNKLKLVSKHPQVMELQFVNIKDSGIG